MKRITQRKRAGRRELIAITAVAAASGSALIVGCASPIRGSDPLSLRQGIINSIRQELVDADGVPAAQMITREPGVERLEINEIFLKELEKTTGPRSYSTQDLGMGPDLFGREQEFVVISLERAIHTAVDNNLAVQFARLAPAISQAQVIAAEAAFDWTYFTNIDWGNTDQPRTSPAIGGRAVGLGSDQRQTMSVQNGIRRNITSGAVVLLQNDYTYTNVETEGLSTSPDPAHEAALTFQVVQPLLRNFGSDVSLAQIRLNRNAERGSISSLKRDLIDTVTQTELAYWQLVRSYYDLQILKRLFKQGEQIRDQIRARKSIDATQASIASAHASVEQRLGDVLAAEDVLRKASDRLKLLMNDQELDILSEVLLVPVDSPLDEPFEFSLLDSIITALEKRPEVVQAILGLDDASIREMAAQSARLPQLDVRFQARLAALREDALEAYGRVTDGHFIDYTGGIVFEIPLGNRAAESSYMQRRLERSQALIALENTYEQVILEVKDALRDVVTNYRLIEQRRTARIAAAETLRALNVELEIARGLTVVDLDLKLRRQEALAQGEQREIQALIDYMNSLANLYSSMGTALERNQIEFIVPDAPQQIEPLDLVVFKARKGKSN